MPEDGPYESVGFSDPNAAGWLAQSTGFAVDVDLDGDGIADTSRDEFNVNGNDDNIDDDDIDFDLLNVLITYSTI